MHPDSRNLKEQVHGILSKYQNKGYYPDAAVAVFTGKSTLFRLGLGTADENTLFDVASLTKVATSTLVLLSIRAGLLSLDTKLLDILPELDVSPAQHKRLQEITLHKLLSHTSGLPEWYPFYADGRAFPLVLLAATDHAATEGMVYSDLNYMILGKILEKVHHKPLEQCLADLLVKPYSLGNMMYHPDTQLNIAPSCYGNPIEEDMCREIGLSFADWRPHQTVRGQVNDGNAYYYFGGISGHAGIFSDVAAYERLAQLYLNTQDPLLVSSTTLHAPTRGLGWQIGPRYPQGCGHTGFTGTCVYFSRALDVGCVTFTNRLYYPHPNTNNTDDMRMEVNRAVADWRKCSHAG